MKNLMKTFGVLLLVSSSLTLTACSSSDHKKGASHSITVKEQAFTSQIHFTSFFSPLNIVPVPSPIAGNIEKLFFQYGQPVKKGQLLFSVKSSQDKNSVQTAVSNFLSTKSKLGDAQNLLENDKLLKQYGLIADNQYQSDQESYYLAELTYLQAKDALKQALVSYHNLGDVYALKLKETKKIEALLNTISQQTAIKIYSPSNGIALLKDNSDGRDADQDDGSKNAQVGSAVKVDQLLVKVGEMNGIALNINVNEINVEQIRVGLPAIITSSALPGLTLKGAIQSISMQADNSDAVPTFAVKIVVPSLTTAQKKTLRFGMSAQINVSVKHEPQLLIPITAVFNRDGKTMVNLINSTGKPKANIIGTGETTENSVVITWGLKPGDKILVPN